MMEGGDGEGEARITEALERLERLERERSTLAAESAQQERELRHAKADVTVKDEYISTLEAQLEARSRYISSLPSVRFKKWLVRTFHLRPRRS